VLAAFQVLAARAPGPPEDVVAQVVAVPELVTEVSCAALGLYADGRYVVAVRALGRDGEVSEASQPVTLEVQQRVISAMTPMEGTCTQDDD
jgi:hypothetical protein